MTALFPIMEKSNGREDGQANGKWVLKFEKDSLKKAPPTPNRPGECWV